nr:MAG TPA: hypothetical protein [Caudoviricetes sp.]
MDASILIHCWSPHADNSAYLSVTSCSSSWHSI